MKRRELLKLSSILLSGLSLGTLGGCNFKEKKNLDLDNNVETIDGVIKKITPQKTGLYEISSPMPLDKTMIDDIVDINKKIKKSKIKVLYSSMPSPLADNTNKYFIAPRGFNYKIDTLDKYIDLIKYSQKKGFKFLYTFNTNKPIGKENKEETFKAVRKLFKELYIAGVKDVKLSNALLLELFQNEFPEINVHLSTTTEYHSISNYENLLKLYPNIKTINVATDDNHNFELLYDLRKKYPHIKLEILVNEYVCVKFCMARWFHYLTCDYGFDCFSYIKSHSFMHLTRNNLVHPWELEYYSALGVNNFKFTSVPFDRSRIENVDYLKYYLECVENGIENYSANDLIEKIYYKFDNFVGTLFPKNYKLSELIKQLPDINYFVENGSNCPVACNSTCKYCYLKAENLKKTIRELI